MCSSLGVFVELVNHGWLQAICVCLIREVRSCDCQYGALLRETAEVLAQYLGAVRHPRVVDVATQVHAGAEGEGPHICSRVVLSCSG